MTGHERTQLAALAKRIPARWIKQKPGGFAADYVAHADIQQILLTKLGPVSQRVVEVIYSPEHVVQGCVLECTYIIDGETVVVQEAGDVERPGNNNGANLKNAVSDAVKRCAMRVGVGLQLWCQDNYVLDKTLTKTEGESDESE